jgi:hypothetical protein
MNIALEGLPSGVFRITLLNEAGPLRTLPFVKL